MAEVYIWVRKAVALGAECPKIALVVGLTSDFGFLFRMSLSGVVGTEVYFYITTNFKTIEA